MAKLVRLDPKVPLAKLHPYPNNPKKHDIPFLRQQLRERGQTRTVVVRERDMLLLAGHGVCEAAVAEKWQTIAVSFVECDDDEAREIVLADNRAPERGGYDSGLLATLLKEVADRSRLDSVGYSPDDLARLIDANRAASGFTDPDATPQLPKVPRSKPGDLYLLGRHRVLCGDSLARADVDRLLAGAEPELLVTDPPYGVELDPTWRDGLLQPEGSGAKPYMRDGKAGIKGDSVADWSPAFELLPSLKLAYVWHADRHALAVMLGMQRLGFRVSQQIIWVKPSMVLSRTFYHSQHEPCTFFRRGTARVTFLGERNQTTVWEAAPPRHPRGHSKEEKTEHPTQKPVRVIAPPIRNHLRPGQLVYDCFLGSGTTLIAAEQLDRVCYGMEIDPRFVDVIVERWERFTGKKAELEGGGRRKPRTSRSGASRQLPVEAAV